MRQKVVKSGKNREFVKNLKEIMMKKISIFLPLIAALALHAESIQYTTYVKVTKSIPEYETVIERTPTQECWTEEVPVTYYETYDAPRSSYRQGGDTTAGAIIGGVTGGVLGHQIGKGRGKDVATVAGAVLGTLAGQNMAKGNQQSYYEEPRRVAKTRYERKRRCTTRYTERKVRNFAGYKNIAYYKGKKIVKYSDRRLKRIPLTVTVTY
jgi:uncharacterized protein YcfJ